MKKSKTCSSRGKKSAKRVRGCDGRYVCVRYGDKNMTIKKHIPSRKKSFCARHRCLSKTNPATPGYQSCKAWNCKVGKHCSRRSTYRGVKKRTKPKSNKPKSQRKSRTRRTYTSASGRKYSRCWKGYKRSGYKLKNGRRVPNCVKK